MLQVLAGALLQRADSAAPPPKLKQIEVACRCGKGRHIQGSDAGGQSFRDAAALGGVLSWDFGRRYKPLVHSRQQYRRRTWLPEVLGPRVALVPVVRGLLLQRRQQAGEGRVVVERHARVGVVPPVVVPVPAVRAIDLRK